MALYQYRLQVIGHFAEKGFGFSCMHMAFQNRISGTLFYESAQSVILEITGEEDDILSAIEQCRKEDYITGIHVLNKIKTKNKSNDFIMLNQID